VPEISSLGMLYSNIKAVACPVGKIMVPPFERQPSHTHTLAAALALVNPKATEHIQSPT